MSARQAPPMRGLLELQAACRDRGIRFAVLTVRNESLMPRARNRLVAHFLAAPEISRLLFVDADSGFTGADALRLLAHDMSLCGGMAPAEAAGPGAPGVEPPPRGGGGGGPPRRPGGVRRARGRLHDDPPRGVRADDRRVAAAGGRQRLRYMVHPVDDPPGPWRDHTYAFFDCGIDEDGRYQSQDCWFCRRWRALDGEVRVDPAINLTHTGCATFAGDAWRDMQDATGAA